MRAGWRAGLAPSYGGRRGSAAVMCLLLGPSGVGKTLLVKRLLKLSSGDGKGDLGDPPPTRPTVGLRAPAGAAGTSGKARRAGFWGSWSPAVRALTAVAERGVLPPGAGLRRTWAGAWRGPEATPTDGGRSCRRSPLWGFGPGSLEAASALLAGGCVQGRGPRERAPWGSDQRGGQRTLLPGVPSGEALVSVVLWGFSGGHRPDGHRGAEKDHRSGAGGLHGTHLAQLLCKLPLSPVHDGRREPHSAVCVLRAAPGSPFCRSARRSIGLDTLQQD